MPELWSEPDIERDEWETFIDELYEIAVSCLYIIFLSFLSAVMLILILLLGYAVFMSFIK